MSFDMTFIVIHKILFISSNLSLQNAEKDEKSVEIPRELDGNYKERVS